jgi:hypothetical protein
MKVIAIIHQAWRICLCEEAKKRNMTQRILSGQSIENRRADDGEGKRQSVANMISIENMSQAGTLSIALGDNRRVCGVSASGGAAYDGVTETVAWRHSVTHQAA